MDTGDRKLFAQSVRRATEQHTGAALDAALDELGWHDALEGDRRDAVSLLFQMQGAANVTSSALDAVLGQRLGLAPGAAAGTSIVLPPLGKWDPPGVLSPVAGDRLAVRGIATGALGDRVAIAWAAGETQVATIPAESLNVRPISGVDPALGVVEVTADLPLRALSPAPAEWAAVVTAGRVAIAYEIVGACQAMLRLASEHALQRVQFGRPIAGFQAVRHRLADSLVAIEAAQACVDSTWDAAGTLAAQLAKAVAGTAARTVGKHAQQVLGGMGYTTDHPLHRYVRRTLVLDQLLGAGSVLTREIGAQLLRTRELPELLPL
jgi:hypothetical protein